jgi:NADPH-dependent glutamate synthase beta subunit-like oxidoreductase/Pyruvate/2-oxoacid:ferredoxin oxidoreductase delta subunit
MGLLRKSDAVKPLRPRMSAASSGSSVSALRPQPVKKASPCSSACLAGTDVREVIALLAQREKLGLSAEEAFEKAWRRIVETNPFPASTGRICPHRCEEGCNRHKKDGGVAVGAIERFLGDFAIERGLALPCGKEKPCHPERIAIVGAGPAGLSCAYQLARRGYATTIFESMPEAGGMLRYGIPPYRLPARVVRAEVQRILDLGVELCTGVVIGRDLTLDELRRDFAAVFIAPGAVASRQVEIPGAEGEGVLRAVDFLRSVALGQTDTLGQSVVVVGGGDTAIDVARVCARIAPQDTRITLLRQENELVGRELSEAMEEGISVELRTTLQSIVRDESGRLTGANAQRVEIGTKIGGGFPTLSPIPGEEFEIKADTVILALGQKPDIASLMPPGSDRATVEADKTGKTRVDGVWRGGDAVAPSLAAVVITQGRQVALSIDAELRGTPQPEPQKIPEVDPARLKLDFYEPRSRLEQRVVEVAVRLGDLQSEVEPGHSGENVIAEARRCLSCGSCFGCERCWMFCTPGCMKRIETPLPGSYFTIKLESCDGCRKCAEECPCGFLEMS